MTTKELLETYEELVHMALKTGASRNLIKERIVDESGSSEDFDDALLGDLSDILGEVKISIGRVSRSLEER